MHDINALIQRCYHKFYKLPRRYLQIRAQVFESYIKGAVMQIAYNKYLIASTRITNTEVYAFTAILVSTLMIRKVLFINRKDNRNC